MHELLLLFLLLLLGARVSAAAAILLLAYTELEFWYFTYPELNFHFIFVSVFRSIIKQINTISGGLHYIKNI